MNKLEEDKQTVIPVENNIEEVLGASLDRNYENSSEEVLNNSTNNVEMLDTEGVQQITPVVPLNIDTTQSFDPTPQDLESVNNSSYDEEYLKDNGVDVNHALELLGDMEMYNMTISDFVKDVEEKWRKICDYKNSNDMPNYAIEVHSLKSDCKYLGFMTLADISYQHELKSKENDSDFVNDNFSELEAEYLKVLEIAKMYVANNPVE